MQGISVVSLLVACVLAVGCSAKSSRFHQGDLVAMKIDGRIGMVVYVCRTDEYCDYHVRFPTGNMSTDTHLLSADGPFQARAYATELVADYELKAAEPASKQ